MHKQIRECSSRLRRSAPQFSFQRNDRLIWAALVGSLATAQFAHAADAPAAPAMAASAAEACDPYKKFECLDDYLGTSVWGRLLKYYDLEMGHDGAPVDPKALPSRRAAPFPPQAQPAPPMPFTEWPYGGGETLGALRTGSIDSPFMVSIANTGIGKWMGDVGLQVYGWFNVGGNISTSSTKPGGNAPAAYLYTPDTVQLDQIVLYVDRFPDTVQNEKIDWGIRFSAIYGENYRYTTEYGYFSNQYLNKNKVNGFDSPMIYGEMFFPKIGGEGLEVRLGRYIAIPDIEAQLAPNNYMYTHSMTYAVDNYTNEGLIGILGVNRNLFLTGGVEIGTDTAFYHYGQNMPQTQAGNPYFPGTTMKVDPGAVPSAVASLRYQTDDAKDDVSITANGINNAGWGYNNQQWYGMTYYHVFNDKWHLSFEVYRMSERKVPNVNNTSIPQGNSTDPGAINGWSTPFSTMVNGPAGAKCWNATVLTCQSEEVGSVLYLNYSPNTLDNFSIRPEMFNDKQGQRTGQAGIYRNIAVGWQHWFSPQIEVRPEADFMTFKGNPGNNGSNFAFNGNPVGGPGFIAPNKSRQALLAADIIFHF